MFLDGPALLPAVTFDIVIGEVGAQMSATNAVASRSRAACPISRPKPAGRPRDRIAAFQRKDKRWVSRLTRARPSTMSETRTAL